jgi:class 3 adenylate cyclase
VRRLKSALPGRRRWSQPPTFLFADLSGYTALTEARGDEEAADVAREFRRTMCALSRDHGARQLKSMGDGVMIWAPDSAVGVALAVRAVAEVGRRPDLLPVSVGLHTGPAVRRGGDWYGSAVNVAARLADQAGPNEALVSDVAWVLAACELTEPVEAQRELALKGIGRPVATWRLA